MIALYRRYALPILVLASFGPNVGGGIRLEHVAAFGLALLGFCLCGGRKLPVTIALAAVAWLALAGIAVADTMKAAASHALPLQNSMIMAKEVDPISFKTILTGLAQLLLPFAAAMIALRSEEGAGRIFALRALVVLTAANTAFAALQLVAPDVAIPILRLFWPGGEEGTSFLSMGNGRFGGIFNHPAEAAMATTLALFVLPVAWKEGAARDWAIGLFVPLLAMGGLLSFSKTVLFLGFPLVAIYYAVEHRRNKLFTRRSATILAGWAAAAAFAAYTVISRLDLSSDSFANLIAITTVGDSGVVGTATGGRFSGGGSGTVAWAFGQVLNLSPILGLGFGTFLAYDSMYLVAFAYAGALGLLVYLSLLGALATRIPKIEHTRPFSFTLLFIALAGLGIPTFTSVRVGVLMTVFICLLLIQPRKALA